MDGRGFSNCFYYRYRTFFLLLSSPGTLKEAVTHVDAQFQATSTHFSEAREQVFEGFLKKTNAQAKALEKKVDSIISAGNKVTKELKTER